MDDVARSEMVTRLQTARLALVEHLQAMAAQGDDDPTVPSLLPGWTRGHVLTHIARNAEAFAHVLAGFDVGESRAAYPDGLDARNAAIEAGAGRPWPELVADVDATAARYEEQLARQQRWEGHAVASSGALTAAIDVPHHRWRETLVHHADLGDAGFTAEDWPPEYVREELRRMAMTWQARRPMGATDLPAEALAAPPHLRLAWLLGRAEIPGLPAAGIF
jgi:maleylpyruvate isomerase